MPAGLKKMVLASSAAAAPPAKARPRPVTLCSWMKKPAAFAAPAPTPAAADSAPIPSARRETVPMIPCFISACPPVVDRCVAQRCGCNNTSTRKAACRQALFKASMRLNTCGSEKPSGTLRQPAAENAAGKNSLDLTASPSGDGSHKIDSVMRRDWRNARQKGAEPMAPPLLHCTNTLRIIENARPWLPGLRCPCRRSTPPATRRCRRCRRCGCRGRARRTPPARSGRPRRRGRSCSAASCRS